ncbi:MAG: glycosyltransferase family 2 protein [Thermoplasmata archaeon]|nr:glycosyltransferase family 2 protein [Thermoplasmata archaeon]
MEEALPPIDVLVATSNSAATLGTTLASARRCLPVHRLIVVDRPSSDATVTIARGYGAEVHSETVGLGKARNLALELAETDPVLFLDSDVEIVREDFYRLALAEFHRPRTAAVVGMSVGHSFRYGLPLGLTLVGRGWALRAGMPDRALGRETYYLQRAARRDHLAVRYVPDSMNHYGTYRQVPHWPEFQGAAIRRSSRWNPRELAYSLVVVLLMHMNSRRPRNVLYTPVFWLKLVRGFLDPGRWERIDRSRATLRPKV